MKKDHAVTNKSNEKEPNLPKGKKPEAELSEADLDKVTGGAVDSYMTFVDYQGNFPKGETK